MTRLFPYGLGLLLGATALVAGADEFPVLRVAAVLVGTTFSSAICYSVGVSHGRKGGPLA